MEQRKNNIFTSDIEIPDIVQKKADFAFSQIRKEKVESMDQNVMEMKTEEKKNKNGKRGTVLRKAVVAAAACAVLATAVGVGDFYLKSRQPVAESVDAQENTNTMNNSPFVLKVQAAGLDGNESKELERGIPVAIDVGVKSWAIGGDGAENSDYCINLPISCEGENIESITYSINKGAFQIVENENASIIVSGNELSERLEVGMIGGHYDEENGGECSYPVSVKYYTDFTLDYTCQSSETTWINMCNVVKISDYNLLWGENRTIADLKQGYQELIDGVVITCTVHFTDGTSQSTDLEVGTVIVSAKEAGFADAGDADAEQVLFTFERK